jgi:hypothetical protein
MEHQQSFSHGLLYSVAPENISRLHLNDESRLDELDWNERRTPLSIGWFASTFLVLVNIISVKLGLAKK